MQNIKQTDNHFFYGFYPWSFDKFGLRRTLYISLYSSTTIFRYFLKQALSEFSAQLRNSSFVFDLLEQF